MANFFKTVTPGEALGDWPALGPPAQLLIASRALALSKTAATGLMVLVGLLLLLYFLSTVGPWYIGLGLVALVGTAIVGPIAVSLVWSTWRLIRAPLSYIYVTADTVEIGDARLPGPGGLQRTRFSREALKTAEGTLSELIFGDDITGGFWFDAPIAIRLNGSQEEHLSHGVDYPWTHTWGGLWHHRQIRKLAIRHICFDDVPA